MTLGGSSEVATWSYQDKYKKDSRSPLPISKSHGQPTCSRGGGGGGGG